MSPQEQRWDISKWRKARPWWSVDPLILVLCGAALVTGVSLMWLIDLCMRAYL